MWIGWLSGVEVAGVKQLRSGSTQGVDKIHPEFLKALDVVRLSLLTYLCNIAWTSGTVPSELQTSVVVPLFKKGDQRVHSSYQGSHSSASLG